MSIEKQNLFKRGFKAWSERTAVEFRQTLNLLPHDHLAAHALAEHLGIGVRPISEFPGDATPLFKDGWSALTMMTRKGRIILYNSNHTPARQQSDLMHELAHIICDHKVPDHYREIAIPSDLRHFNPSDEEEAKYLGGSLQLPREALLKAFKAQWKEDQIASFHCASIEMVRYRIGITGIMHQVRRWNR